MERDRKREYQTKREGKTTKTDRQTDRQYQTKREKRKKKTSEREREY